MGEEDDIQRRHLTAEQTARNLVEADRLLVAGTALVQVCKHLKVTEATCGRWRNRYGSLKADDAKPMKGTDMKNARLKRLAIEQVLDTILTSEVL